jgi:hypothetical protein
MAAAAGDTAFEAKLDEDNRNRRLGILIKHFEADERFYLDMKENFPIEEDYPQATVIVFVDKGTALGYNGSNRYSLVCMDANELHADIPRTLPPIENLGVWIRPGSCFHIESDED